MTRLAVLRYPDPRLRIVAKPVHTVDERIRKLVDDMLETMYAVNGVGLAATQVDVHERVIVIDTSPASDDPRVLINPELLSASEDVTLGDERCLSVPHTRDKVRRHARVRVRALGRDGEPLEFEADGQLAVAVQHELDHLDGKVFVDHLSALKRARIHARLLKRLREDGRA